MRVLVVAAWEPELARFRALVGEALARHLDLRIAPIGVGVVEAAMGMTRCIAEHSPTHAVLLGTCGIMVPISTWSPDALASPPVVVASRVQLVTSDLLAGTAEVPPPMPVEVTAPRDLHDEAVGAGARSVAIAATVGITVDDELAERLGRSGDVEHLEAFAFARACAATSVRWGAILGGANRVGSTGRGEWRAHHEAASARAAEVAVQALDALARA